MKHCHEPIYYSNLYRKMKRQVKAFLFFMNSHIRQNKWDVGTCVKLPFNHEVKCVYWVSPADMVRCGSAVHIWWPGKESQVVLQSIAQSSVLTSKFDICHPVLLQGREKSAFPYASHFILPAVLSRWLLNIVSFKIHSQMFVNANGDEATTVLHRYSELFTHIYLLSLVISI